MTHYEVIAEFARLTKSYLVVIAGINYRRIKNAPYLDYDNPDHREVIFDGRGVIVCTTEKEAYDYFNQTTLDDMDDGVYASVINSNGVTETENT